MEIIRMLSGTFTNEEQIRNEEEGGIRIHPAAKHVITPCGHLISNTPEELKGGFVIEESYFDMVDRIIDKHYLFLYENVDKNTVRLTSYDLPEAIKTENFTGSNDSIRMDFRDLRVSPRFEPLILEKNNDEYYGENVSSFGPGKVFRFSLRVSEKGFEVKELLEADGKRFAGYDTPVVYKKAAAVKPR